MKILVVTEGFPPLVGGIENHVYELSKKLEEEHEVRIVLLNSRDFNPDESFNIRKYEHFTGSGILRKLSDIKRQAKIFSKEVDDFEPDIIHTHSLQSLYGLSLFSLGREKPPIVFTNHSSGFLKEYEKDSFYTKAKSRTWFYAPDQIITPSAELKEATQHFTEKNVVEIPNGVDTDKFSPEGSKSEELDEKSKGKFTVLTTRRFVKKNGMEYLVKAIPKTSEDIYFALIGDGPERERLKEYVKDNALEDRVWMPGEVPNSEMASYYRSADVTILPSKKEAISISGLESMSCGTPVIGTKVGGIIELIDHQENGLLVEPENPSAIAEAINKVLLTDLECLQESARKKIEDNFSWKEISKETENIYKKAIRWG